jgi:hypothetical protein
MWRINLRVMKGTSREIEILKCGSTIFPFPRIFKNPFFGLNLQGWLI